MDATKGFGSNIVFRDVDDKITTKPALSYVCNVFTPPLPPLCFMIVTHLLDTPRFAHVVQSYGEDDDEVDDLGGEGKIQQLMRKRADGEGIRSW